VLGLAYCGSSTGKPFIPLGSATETPLISVVVFRRVHFAPTGDNLDRCGDEQSGDNNHGEYVTHGNPSFFILG
jgi:hypothetical protein